MDSAKGYKTKMKLLASAAGKSLCSGKTLKCISQRIGNNENKHVLHSLYKRDKLAE